MKTPKDTTIEDNLFKAEAVLRDIRERTEHSGTDARCRKETAALCDAYWKHKSTKQKEKTMKILATKLRQLKKRLKQVWSDFQYVRHNSSRPLEGLAKYSNGVTTFDMIASTRRFGDCYIGLPKWLRKLAVLTARRHNNEPTTGEE